MRLSVISRVLIQRNHFADLQHIQHVDGEPTCFFFLFLLAELTAVFLSPYCAETVTVLPCSGFNSVSYLFFIPPACSPTVSRTRSPLTALPKGLSNSLQGALGLEGAVREAERERERERERGGREMGVVWILISLAVFQGFWSRWINYGRSSLVLMLQLLYFIWSLCVKYPRYFFLSSSADLVLFCSHGEVDWKVRLSQETCNYCRQVAVNKKYFMYSCL